MAGRSRAIPLAALQATGRYWVAGKVVDAALIRAATGRIKNRLLREEVERFLEGQGPFPSEEALAVLQERLYEVLMAARDEAGE